MSERFYLIVSPSIVIQSNSQSDTVYLREDVRQWCIDTNTRCMYSSSREWVSSADNLYGPVETRRLVFYSKAEMMLFKLAWGGIVPE